MACFRPRSAYASLARWSLVKAWRMDCDSREELREIPGIGWGEFKGPDGEKAWSRQSPMDVGRRSHSSVFTVGRCTLERGNEGTTHLHLGPCSAPCHLREAIWPLMACSWFVWFDAYSRWFRSLAVLEALCLWLVYSEAVPAVCPEDWLSRCPGNIGDGVMAANVIGQPLRWHHHRRLLNKEHTGQQFMNIHSIWLIAESTATLRYCKWAPLSNQGNANSLLIAVSDYLHLIKGYSWENEGQPNLKRWLYILDNWV